MELVIFISSILIIIGLSLLLVNLCFSKYNNNPPIKEGADLEKIAIIIPARDESRVIKGLLDSIKAQTTKIDFSNVFVIVEDKLDKTVQICSEYKAQVIVRKHLELQRKGYAIDEAIKDIKARHISYDAYFIMDADNVLDKEFISKMTNTYKAGYDIGVGYRNCKNGNDNVIAAVSSLTFFMINTLGNERRNKYTANVTISGTGFYIRGSIIEKWGCYPFHSLTEDYELTLYSNLEPLTTYYNAEAIFYDEQPTDYKQTIIQRTRWIKGYFDSRREYIPKLKNKIVLKGCKNKGSLLNQIVGVNSFILMVIGAGLYFLNNIMIFGYNFIFNDELTMLYLYKDLTLLFVIYLVMMFITIFMISHENKKIKLNRITKIKAIFYNPIFLASYVPCIIKAMTTKEIGWQKIDHTVNVHENS